MTERNDFSKFVLFVKGVLETGWVIKNSHRRLNNEAKMHFNRLLNDAMQFEKYIHKEMGPEMATFEDDINSELINLIWKIFDLSAKGREEFIEHINKFEQELQK
jgi:hypothetical protein